MPETLKCPFKWKATIMQLKICQRVLQHLVPMLMRKLVLLAIHKTMDTKKNFAMTFHFFAGAVYLTKVKTFMSEMFLNIDNKLEMT